ncbi:MAG: hypothetical protein ABS81_07155 [Pseudonocardia sp. SCN 72-86]|nr:MAG: hypothetical protein ABS81_07155 [Pseudonocardia sp. SCN 72-86]
MIGRAAAREFSTAPLTGFKIAVPVISADGATTAFRGVGAGRARVYRAVDDAVCVNNSRHAVPHPLCRCGFYCLHTMSAARDLTCVPENRDTVVLEVAASGRYRRHELGLRYAHQRVRTVWTGRCRCGRAAELFVDSGGGRLGWRELVARCAGCAGERPTLTRDSFAALTGDDTLRAHADREPLRRFETATTTETPARAGDAVVDAELAVINARIDELHTQVEDLLRPG